MNEYGKWEGLNDDDDEEEDEEDRSVLFASLLLYNCSLRPYYSGGTLISFDFGNCMERILLLFVVASNKRKMTISFCFLVDDLLSLPVRN